MVDWLFETSRSSRVGLSSATVCVAVDEKALDDHPAQVQSDGRSQIRFDDPA